MVFSTSVVLNGRWSIISNSPLTRTHSAVNPALKSSSIKKTSSSIKKTSSSIKKTSTVPRKLYVKAIFHYVDKTALLNEWRKISTVKNNVPFIIGCNLRMTNEMSPLYRFCQPKGNRALILRCQPCQIKFFCRFKSHFFAEYSANFGA